jgi:Ca-activated chloride channel homolog
MIVPAFDQPILLLLAAVLTVLAATGTTIWVRRRKGRLARLGGADLLRRLAPAAVSSPLAVRAALITLAVLLAGVALAGPRWGQERAMVQASGIDLVVAMDASLSMLAQDERPSRLERAKAEVRRLRSLSPGDRVALLAFAGRSYILTPLTLDDGALDLYLDNLEPSVVGQAGSSLASTLRQGTDLLLATKSGSDRALVVFTDGEIFEEEPDVVEAARYARENNVNVVLVGFGSPRGSTIPVTDERGRPSQKKDENGVVVITRNDPQLLDRIAREAGGVAISATDSDKAARIRSALAGLRRERRAVASSELLQHRFQLFLLPAIALLLIDTLLSERRGRRRRASAIAAVSLVLALPSPARADDAADGVRALRAGRNAEAAALLKRAVDGGDRRPVTLYNYGTALLALDSLSSAADVLERASQQAEGGLRYLALFNTGYAHLRRGLAAEGDSAQVSLAAALEAYKRALLMRPSDADAKWNYELALRKRRSGGGGGGGGRSQQGGSGQQEAPEQEPAGGVGNRQAEQILNSAARDERDVQGRRMRRNRPDIPPGGKDW